ncbi:hypothetical protein, partial [Desulfovibrio sp. 1214_IL3152]|uniref:hypothetical protein n=1 Tax=Desulfovibrio sp. 1214_IL3152 TaxID=3084056 RepID=UPI002FDB724C
SRADHRADQADSANRAGRTGNVNQDDRTNRIGRTDQGRQRFMNKKAVLHWAEPPLNIPARHRV